jgi:hypothetical protein
MTKKVKQVKEVVEVKKDKYDLSKFKTKSEKIRYLDSIGLSRSEIAKELKIIYQHVRNVLEMPLKRDMNKKK